MLNPQGRKAEFEKLDVPVTQVMPYRKGDAQAWQDDPHGISLTDTPFYLVQPELAGVIDPVLAAATSRGDGAIVSLPAQLDAVADKALALARSSNLYGMLTTDDPFQYLGGIGLAVRHLTGKAPELLISNLRDPSNARTETAASFLASELRTRYFHPGWIEGMKAEGYSGALSVLDTVNNFWGWTASRPRSCAMTSGPSSPRSMSTTSTSSA